jgi:phenylpropionate dioxygenase-like ring-hydroxylating dioxygenase large terminal subunit
LAAVAVPFAIELPDRIPKQRYYDPEFFALEAERLWPRVWQMACRLEEIPNPGDFAEYEILDQSVVVVRQADLSVRAFENACRHRGVRVVQGRGHTDSGFTCPFHGWCYANDGANTAVTRRKAFAPHNLEPADLDLTPVRCETWGGCAWINLSDEAPPLRQCIEPAATILDGWKVESLRAEWWYAARLPANWKLAEEAFVEQYHVLEAHPQLRIPDRIVPRNVESFDPRRWLDGELQYLRVMSEGMDGMVHASDVEIAERLAKEIELPADPQLAMSTWHRSLNDAVNEWHRAAGHDMPDLNELEAAGMNEPMAYVMPHWFVLPMYSSASSYRFRPLGPEETLMEIWSLTRHAPGSETAPPPVPEVWMHDDPRWPPIPAQDFSNIPRQQKGLHARGYEYLRISSEIEGHISNFHRVLDGFLAGLPYERLLPAMSSINVDPLEMKAVDFSL